MADVKGATLSPYTPPPSIANELGITFGFMGLMVVVMGTYWVVWGAAQKRSAKKEQERRARLAERGISEKSVERE